MALGPLHPGRVRLPRKAHRTRFDKFQELRNAPLAAIRRARGIGTVRHARLLAVDGEQTAFVPA